jgi:predicted acyl esterase
MQMRPQPEPPTQEVFAGLVERVTYHNAENGFCVVRAQARGSATSEGRLVELIDTIY